MESKVNELGKLKYSIALEVSFKEMKPTYDAIFGQLKNTRHNGFRRGKHPKGWLDKRFLSLMQKEAVERLIPGYMETALKEHSLKPATVPIIKNLEFNKNAPLSVTLDFEIAPSLPLLDYSQIKLERKKIDEVKDLEIEEELKNLVKREEFFVPKEGEDIKVEVNDFVKVNFSGLIEGKEFQGSKAKDLQFLVGGEEFVEFHEGLIGMAAGDQKNVEIILSDNYADNKGKKANFNIQLNGIFLVKSPELNSSFFSKMGVESLDELKKKIDLNINSRRKDELQTGYRLAVSSQILDLYDEFDLPEQLIENENEKIKKSVEKEFTEKKITVNEKKNKLNEELDNLKKELRKKFILDSISDHENLVLDENEVAKEFVGLAQMTGQSPDKLFQSQFGREIYQRIIVRKKEDIALDRVISKVFGDPIDKNISDKNEHVHDEKL